MWDVFVVMASVGDVLVLVVFALVGFRARVVMSSG